jgi:Flp pilus assembly pilin Flp
MPERKYMMKNIVFRFCHDETGAVTVDWVVLSAAIIGIGMLVLTPIAYSTDSSASKIAANIANQSVGYPSSP